MNSDFAIDAIIKMYSNTFGVMSETITSQCKIITLLEAENARLKELLQHQLQQRFGKSAECDRQESVPDEERQDGQDNKVHVAAHTRKKKRKGKLASFDNLPSFQQIYDLNEAEKTCKDCDGRLHLLKTNSTKQIEIIPLRHCVVEHIQHVYACRCCNTVVAAPKPQPPIPKAMAGASLLADVVISKYQFHQPLYRQSKIMRSQDVMIPDNTLGNWMVNIGFALKPLYDAMWCILYQRYLQVDETPVKILEPNKKGYLWTYYSPHMGENNGLIVFELSETRAGEVANNRLQSFNGLLQTDGYAGYQKLRDRDGIIGLGCFTHARRKYSEVVKITKDNNGIAAQMLERMKPLYALEKRMKTLNVNFHTRKRLRQKIARPITKEIYRWLMSIKNDVPPKSKLGHAIRYTLKQWPYLVAYLRHGQAEIDTNYVENKIREIALGKKNWLFIGNQNSGEMHAIFYSLVISCILNNINPRVYIHYVITKVHQLRRQEISPIDILPHTIDVNVLNEFANDQIVFAKKIFDSS